MDAQVVDARLRDLRGLADEARDPGAGHLECEDLVDDGADRGRRLDLECGAEDVAVEDHVQVLVGRDPDHDPVRDRVVRVAPGVAVGDARRQLLERDVGEPAQRRRRRVVVALLELGHPAALEQDRVDVAGDRQVVAQDDRVAALLGGPAADPVDPRPIALAEHPVDEPVVGGQVVLGQEADLERRLGDAGETRLVRRPRVLVEVAPEPVRDELVREPLLGDLGVAVVQAARLGFELDEQRLVHRQRFGWIEPLAGFEAAFGVGHVSPGADRSVSAPLQPSAAPTDRPGTDAGLHTSRGARLRRDARCAPCHGDPLRHAAARGWLAARARRGG